MTRDIKSLVFSRNVVEFVTVALEYCTYLETVSDISQTELTDRISKLLPLIYLKSSLLPDTELIDDIDLEIGVGEEDYNFIISKLCVIYAKDDTYLEVFLEDMKYSDTPIVASISEDLADIYQDLKNFLFIYELGVVENMNNSLHICTENFKTYWGQNLVNVMRAIHSLKYMSNVDMVENEDFDQNERETW